MQRSKQLIKIAWSVWEAVVMTVSEDTLAERGQGEERKERKGAQVNSVGGGKGWVRI